MIEMDEHWAGKSSSAWKRETPFTFTTQVITDSVLKERKNVLDGLIEYLEVVGRKMSSQRSARIMGEIKRYKKEYIAPYEA